MATRLLLIRHGQIRANRTGHWHGSTDSRLTWTGRRQARRTGRFLQNNHNISGVYASPLRRCQETAEALALELTVNPHPGLREMSIGEWETMSFRALAEEHNFMRRITGDPHFRAPEGETLHEVAQRVSAALLEIESGHADDETIVVVSHGVALAAGLSRLLENTESRWTDFRFHNCGITEIALQPQPALYSIDNYSHL